jgi:hypothetical protein
MDLRLKMTPFSKDSSAPQPCQNANKKDFAQLHMFMAILESPQSIPRFETTFQILAYMTPQDTLNLREQEGLGVKQRFAILMRKTYSSFEVWQ